MPVPFIAIPRKAFQRRRDRLAVVKTGPPRFPLLSIVFHPWILCPPSPPSLLPFPLSLSLSPPLPFRRRLSLPVHFIDRSFESLRPISPMRHVIENKTGFRLCYYLCVANRRCVETSMHRPTQASPLELKKGPADNLDIVRVHHRRP